MHKFFLTILILGIGGTSQAQKLTQQQYIDSFKAVAISEMIRSGVPAAITLAQGILESESGNSELAIKANNHFGIKCKEEWSGEKMYHDDDERGECFRKYKTVQESYIDHSNFLKYRPYYTSLFKLDPSDYKSWAIGLRDAGYATSRSYASQLIEIIERFNLNQYSLQALQQMNPSQNNIK
jgi:flagellum-specific peptidoglycan hydrolase FlgJ